MQTKYREAIVKKQDLQEKLQNATNEGISIKEALEKLPRHGRQPSIKKESKEKRRKREDRVSGRSFENGSQKSSTGPESDTSSFMGGGGNGGGNMMFIPEDDNPASKEPSPQFGHQLAHSAGE